MQIGIRFGNLIHCPWTWFAIHSTTISSGWLLFGLMSIKVHTKSSDRRLSYHSLRSCQITLSCKLLVSDFMFIIMQWEISALCLRLLKDVYFKISENSFICEIIFSISHFMTQTNYYETTNPNLGLWLTWYYVIIL